MLMSAGCGNGDNQVIADQSTERRQVEGDTLACPGRLKG
jgi:hypothetical protein